MKRTYRSWSSCCCSHVGWCRHCPPSQHRRRDGRRLRREFAGVIETAGAAGEAWKVAGQRSRPIRTPRSFVTPKTAAAAGMWADVMASAKPTARCSRCTSGCCRPRLRLTGPLTAMPESGRVGRRGPDGAGHGRHRQRHAHRPIELEAG